MCIRDREIIGHLFIAGVEENASLTGDAAIGISGESNIVRVDSVFICITTNDADRPRRISAAFPFAPGIVIGTGIEHKNLIPHVCLLYTSKGI